MSARTSRGRTRNALADITPAHDVDISNEHESESYIRYYEYREQIATISRESSGQKSMNQRKRQAIELLDNGESPNRSGINDGPIMKPDIVSFFRTPGVYKYRRRTSSEPQIGDYFEQFQIPSECLLKIFENFNKRDMITAMKTCKRFYAIGEDKDLWESLDLANKAVRLSDIFRIIGRGCQVLRLCGAKVEIDWEEATALLDYGHMTAPLLTHLDLSRCTLPTSAIDAILSGTSYLQGISLENCELTSEIFDYLEQNKYLVYLDLSMASNIKASDIRRVLPKLTRIEELNMSWCGLDTDALNAVVKSVTPNIKRLCLAGSKDKISLMDAHIFTLCARCTFLVEVDLSDSTEITRDGLVTLLQLPNIDTLTLSRCFAIHPLAYLTCLNIARLNIFGCVTEEGEQTLRMRLQNTAINMDPYSHVARPTPPPSVTSIWKMKVKDLY